MNYRITIGRLLLNFVITIPLIFLFLINVPANAQDGTLKWQLNIGWIDNSPAIGTDGTIYASSDDLYAINPDGTLKWTFPMGSVCGETTSPSIGADGSIYISCNNNLDECTFGGPNSINAINPDGTLKWTSPIHGLGWVSESTWGQAIGVDGTIYVNTCAGIYAINPDGTLKWQFDTTDWQFGTPVIGTDGTIYTGDYALNPDGTQRWKYPTNGSHTAIGIDGTIYMVEYDNLHAINPDGSQKWVFSVNIGGPIHSTPAIGADGILYVKAHNGGLYAINPDGTQKWYFLTDGSNSSPAVGSDGIIYVGSGGDPGTSGLYAINPDGTQKWVFSAGWIYSAPTIKADGTIYVGSRDGNLYAINSSSMGLATSSWPMFMHDERHTGQATKPPVKENFSYAPVKPCRIVDTRKTKAGIIGASTQRNFHVFGDGSTISSQGGNSAGCPEPLGDPSAVHINMVAVNPTGKGNLQAFPVGTGTGAGLSVNYNTIDTNLANAGTVKTVTGSGPDITVASNFSSAHTVIDVLGYFYPDGDLLYTPVMPCRIVDTRYTSAGIIDANTERNFRVSGSGGVIFAQGGNPDGCLSPLGEPLAAHINMVAVYPYGKGNLQAFPVDAETGAGLSVNYNILDTNLANAGTVKTNEGAGADITVASSFSSAHTVIDALGYFYPDGDLLYTPVTPCRIVDTRKTSAGIIDANTERNFRVFGSSSTISAQGGNSAGCSAPSGEPLAAHLNMIAVNPTGKGNLQAFPLGAGIGAGLSVNYNTIDTNLANAGTVKTVMGTGPDITVFSNFSSAHTVIDVLGYYYPAP